MYPIYQEKVLKTNFKEKITFGTEKYDFTPKDSSRNPHALLSDAERHRLLPGCGRYPEV